MTGAIPTTGNPVVDTMTRIFGWLGSRLPEFTPPRSAPTEPAKMTDAQLLEAIFAISKQLIDQAVGPWMMASFDGGTINEPLFKGPMPTKPRDSVLLTFASADDSACLAEMRLHHCASAAATGALRNVAESFVQLSWLLDTDDDRQRLGRTYGLIARALEDRRRTIEVMRKWANRTGRTPHPWMALLEASQQRSCADLDNLVQANKVTIEPLPPNVDLFEQYLADEGGYLFFSQLSNAGVHAGASRAFAFYGSASEAKLDFDFQGKHGLRAYWLSVCLRLHIKLCRLVAPELGWPDWATVLDELQARLDPLAAEADRRILTPLTEFIEKNLPEPAAASPAHEPSA